MFYVKSKMIKFLILISLINLALCQTPDDALNVRGLVSILSANTTLLLKLNSQALLQSSKFSFGESTVDKWLFRNGNSDAPKPIYLGRKLNDQLRYTCQPNNDNCDSLLINQFSVSDIGEYARSGSSSDFTKITVNNYYISAYDMPLGVKCYSPSSPQSACVYNATTNSLHVKENDLITLTCSASIWRTVSNQLPAEIFYKSPNDQYECQSNENRVLTKQNLNSQLTQNIEMSKDCTRAFQRHDTQFTCGLKYLNEYSNGVIESIGLNLNVHYGPARNFLNTNELNRTIQFGSGGVLKCPFDGYPITYYWRVISSSEQQQQFNVGEREFILPRSSQVGQYKYECKAFVDGFIRNSSETVQFNVNVVELKTATARKGNMPAIIGGAVGGLVGLILIIILIVYLLKCRRSNDDDIEKPKEQESLTKGNGQPKSILRKDNTIYKASDNDRDVSEHSVPLNINIVDDSATDGQRVTLNEPPFRLDGSQLPKKSPKMIHQTKGATEILNFKESAYSPSVAESRQKDAAAPDANLPIKSLTSSRTDLAIKAGGYKVLPTQDKVFKLNKLNQQPQQQQEQFYTNNNSRDTTDTVNSMQSDLLNSSSTMNTNSYLTSLGHRQPYAAIAHAAAAAAASNCYNNSASSQSARKIMSYNNPGFYESNQFSNQNPGESPPSYDAALQDSPKTLPKSYQPQQHYQSQTLLSNNGSNGRFGGSNTKLSTTSSQQPLYNPNGQQSNPHLNSQIEYSDVVNTQNRARNRDPISSRGNLADQSQQQQTQYSSVSQFTLPKPINV